MTAPFDGQSFDGRCAFITGAAHGQGRAVALALAAEGADIVGLDVAAKIEYPAYAQGSSAELDSLKAEVETLGRRALVFAADVRSSADVQTAVDAAIAEFGRIDVLFNNAGIVAYAPVDEMTDLEWDSMIDVNLKGLIFGAHAALNLFRAQGYGTLINTGSIDSETPLALQNTYASTKAAVLSLSRILNEELKLAGEEHIRVGTIMPWGVDTPWWTHAANYTGHAPRMALLDDPQLVVDAIVHACLDPKEEQPVGWKAKGSDISHHLAPKLTEWVSAKLSKTEAEKASFMPETRGAIHEPVDDGLRIDGGIRERMRQDDAGAHH